MILVFQNYLLLLLIMYLVSKIVNHVTYLFVYRSGFIVMIGPLVFVYDYMGKQILKKNATTPVKFVTPKLMILILLF